MTESTLDVEAALQRVISLGEALDDGAGKALAGARRAIVEFLRHAGEPQPIDAVAAAIGLHANTTRHHLEVLASAQLVEGVPAPAVGRGRPRTLYRATAAVTDSFDQVDRTLTEALAAHGEDEVALATARRWLASAPPVQTAKDLDDAVRAAVEALRAAGFDARSDAIGDSIVVTDCPYVSLISEHPMICTVHAELTARVLTRTGQPVELEVLDVWVRPGVCRARLRRPDTAPTFSTIPIRNDAPEEA